MAGEENNRGAFRIQAFYCESNASPVYARVATALAEGLTRDSAVGRRVLDWPGEPTLDALPLRLIGGLHALVLAGKDAALAAVFRGEITDAAQVTTILNDALVRHDEAVLPWLDGPPQTNEPGRSAALMTGLIEVARRFGPKLELLEIGSSAGLNLLIDRYRIDLGGTVIGPRDAAVTIVPDWRGAAPDVPAIEIVSVKGCDVAPMDATDPAVEARLAAYVWAEEPERLTRVRAAIAMMRKRGVNLVEADAADWVEARLAEPQAHGVTRVLMHSVVWQYLPEPVADRIRAAMAAAGARATPERPLAWVMMESDRALGYQVIRVRHWPDGEAWRVVGSSHAHGRWIKPGALDASDGIELPDSAKLSPG
ncbi:DUF2332 domain-containing protein [Sphingomonas oligophenolica]|uniref:DUF2332 domain-containing protein n=1 Tax=Sphingomonas oligophenolica TaxID=301154 RepID=A0A502CHL9_9SPHN|nr:DUF2332 family protein [Sphingomonas oligophenolica]TPG12212.1 DUF2332 domain-containing protein [Sphingomonas oligophenolica]